MDISEIVSVTSRAWSIEILAALNRGTTGRQSALVQATGAGRTALNESVNHLIGLGLLERNPGHVHPLRPEFRLTKRGSNSAQIAGRILAETPRNAVPMLRRVWTIPTLVAIHEPLPFGAIRVELKTVTDRALSQTLKNLESINWLDRLVDVEARPPRPLYRACGVGRRISMSIVGA